MEIVCLDFVSLERSNDGFEKVSSYHRSIFLLCQAIPIKKENAQKTARVLYDHCFQAGIHSDQDANVVSNLIKELCNIVEGDQS